MKKLLGLIFLSNIIISSLLAANFECTYDKLPSPEFRYNNSKFAIGQYFYDDKGFPFFKDKHFNELSKHKFKFSGNPNPSKSFGKSVHTITIGDKDYDVYVGDQIAVVFENCIAAAWFGTTGGFMVINNKDYFSKVDGSDLNIADYAYMLGLSNVKESSYKPNFEVDDFSKTTTVYTDMRDGIMLRTWIDSNIKPKEFQIYVELTFIDDWGFIKSARTKDGKQYEVLKIDSKSNCESYACFLKETVGVALPIDFLRKNMNGFDIKFYGTRSAVKHISRYHIKTLLNGLDNTKTDK